MKSYIMLDIDLQMQRHTFSTSYASNSVINQFLSHSIKYRLLDIEQVNRNPNTTLEDIQRVHGMLGVSGDMRR